MLNQITAIHGTGVAASTNSYESIATITASGSSSSINFTSIPSTFKHLQLRFIARDSSSNGAAGIKFNSDTTASNYYSHGFYGDGSAVYAGNSSTNTDIFVISYNGQTANAMAVGVVDILDYADTNKYKVLRSLNGNDLNGSGQLQYRSVLWKNTNAISAININMQGGSNFTSTSVFALYGIKG